METCPDDSAAIQRLAVCNEPQSPPQLLELFRLIVELNGKVVDVINAQEERQRAFAKNIDDFLSAAVQRQQEFEKLGGDAVTSVAARQRQLADEMHALVGVLEKWRACPTAVHENLDGISRQLQDLLGRVLPTQDTRLSRPVVRPLPVFPEVCGVPPTRQPRLPPPPTSPPTSPPTTPPTTPPASPPTSPRVPPALPPRDSWSTMTLVQRKNMYTTFRQVFTEAERCELAPLGKAITETAEERDGEYDEFPFEVPSENAARIIELISRIGIVADKDGDYMRRIAADIAEACKNQTTQGGAAGYKTLAPAEQCALEFLQDILIESQRFYDATPGGHYTFVMPAKVVSVDFTAQALAKLGIPEESRVARVASRPSYHVPPQSAGFDTDALILAISASRARPGGECGGAHLTGAIHKAQSRRSRQRAAAARYAASLQDATPADADAELWA